jgi:hypothetical protein
MYRADKVTAFVMTARKLTPAQEQARLQAASRCPDCKAIWDSFPDEFCDSHSESAWRERSSSKSSLSEDRKAAKAQSSSTTQAEKSKPRQSKASTKAKWPRRIRAIVITMAVLGGLYWYGNTLEPENTSNEQGSASEQSSAPARTTVVEEPDLSWVPAGMQVLGGSEDVAFRYLGQSELDCLEVYSRGKCVGVELVTKDDCRTLFAYLRWKDFGGYDRPFDATTDSKGVTNHRAGVRLRLFFETQDDLDAIRTGRLDSVDCL